MPGHTTATRVALTLWLTITSPVVTAELLSHRAWDPVAAGFGLPAPAARSAADGSFAVSLEHYNIYSGGAVADEALLLDSEGTRLDLRYRRRLGCTTAAIEGGWLAYHGGVLDEPIDTWHGWFDMPNAGREFREPSLVRLVYRDSTDGGLRTRDIDSDVSGPGDVFVSLQRPGRCTDGGDIWRLGLKLPLGDDEDWLGSGTVDLFADWQSPAFDLAHGVELALSIGVMRGGDSELFARQRRWVAYGAVGAGWRLAPASRLFAQFDWHGPLFDSALRELGDTAGSLTVGHAWRLGRGTLDLAIAEDVLIDTTPDITFHIGWRSTGLPWIGGP